MNMLPRLPKKISNMIHSRLAREKAHNILRMFGVTEPPVDIDRIAKLLDFKIVSFDFPDSVSAVIRIEGSSKVIGVNKKHALVRQKFSIAHELGHYLSGHENFSHEKTMFVDPEKKYLDPQYIQEQEADEFAAELLMPEDFLKNDVTVEKLKIADLAKKYNVSEQAMTIQLINLQLPVQG